MTRSQADQREDARILRDTRASLMSDTKWRKLIQALNRPDLTLSRCVLKLIDEPEPRTTHLPNEASFSPPRPWIDASIGPIRLRTIEWLFFPRSFETRPMDDRTLPATRHQQDVEAAAEVLTALGRYPIELTEEGLLVRGYLSRD
jgi:hypothetical protein